LREKAFRSGFCIHTNPRIYEHISFATKKEGISKIRRNLSCTQADPQTRRLSGPQCKCRPLAGLERPALLSVAALPGVPLVLGAAVSRGSSP